MHNLFDNTATIFHHMSASADVGLLLPQMQCRPNSHSYSTSKILLRGWNNGGGFVHQPSAAFLVFKHSLKKIVHLITLAD